MFFFLLLFSLSRGLPIQAQALRSLDRVEHIRTNSFDIYFPATLADQGKRLAGFADTVLASLDGFFDIAPPIRRIPVLLSDVEIDLNGYFSPYPSNRIVIYVAGAGASGQLASLGDELRSVFEHELTHFVSLNMRSPFWSTLSAIFGDFLAPTAWMMPNAFVEGMAVWIESRSVASGTMVEGVIPSTGRLNDPAALEPVYMDIIQGRRRELWDVSNVADFPGSGALPYLYGALFVEFLDERYGRASIENLWRMAAKGNIFDGFDGTLTTQGALESCTGQPPAALWDEFLNWLGRRAEKEVGARAGTIGAAGGRIGAFCADEEKVYYLDSERGGVVALDIAAGQTSSSTPLLLFHADGYIEHMEMAPGGMALEIDWVRSGPSGRLIPARYAYDLKTRRLFFQGNRDVEKAGAAIANLTPGSNPPFLHASRLDPKSGYRYGLVRMGSRTMAGRLSPEGAMELLDSPLVFIRSLSLREGLETADRQGTKEEGGERSAFVLSATLPGGLSRIALAKESPDGWKLYLQKTAPEGGAFAPVFSGATRLVYRAELGDGKRELRTISIDADALASFFECSAISWKPLESIREMMSSATLPAGKEDRSAESQSDTSGVALRPVLFPRAFAASRYPYMDKESIHLKFEGSDLTERLTWYGSAGWNFVAKVPEASLGLGLSIDEQHFGLAASDSTNPVSGAAPATRILGGAIDYGYRRNFLPINRRLWAGVAGNFAGLKKDYTAADYFSTAFDYTSIGASASMGYSTMRSLPFAPFDKQGFSVAAGLDYENLPRVTSALSFSGALSFALPHPTATLALYGAFSPGSDLLFHPSGRYYSTASLSYPSAIAAPYPYFDEYEALASGSPWYCFGELSARIATIELWKAIGPLRMPSLPSWTIRRISLWGGLRAALLDQSGIPALPSSAFARVEIDAALLAGLASEGHIALNLEASLAFSPALAGGQALRLNFGFGVTY